MKIGHIFLENLQTRPVQDLFNTVSVLDGLAIDQFVLTASRRLARKLHALPYVSVGPVVRAPVMAYCLMPDVDLVHAHDARAGQAGLLLTLTRGMPFVMSIREDALEGPLTNSMRQRAQAIIDTRMTDAGDLVDAYEQAILDWSKLPADTDSR